MLVRTVKNWLPILVPFTVSRGLILLILFMVSQAHIVRHQAWEGEVISPHVELGTREIKSNLNSIFSSGDARWYLDIAENGYDFSNLEVKKMRNWVFFPLVPLLISFLSKIVGSKILAGLILSNISFLFFLRVLFEIGNEERMDEETKQRMLWLICFFPISYFFFVPLTESIFALALASSYLMLKKRKIPLASCLLGLAVFTRPTGILILPAFALSLWLNTSFNLKRMIYFFLPSGIVLSGLLSFYYLNTNDPFAFITNQFFWDRSGSIITLIKNFIGKPGVLITGWNFIGLNIITLVVCLIAIFDFLKKKEWDFAAFIFLPLAASLNTGTLLALTRIAMPIFPLMIFLAKNTKKPLMEKSLLLVFAALLGIMTVLYALHVTPAMA